MLGSKEVRKYGSSTPLTPQIRSLPGKYSALSAVEGQWAVAVGRLGSQKAERTELSRQSQWSVGRDGNPKGVTAW